MSKSERGEPIKAIIIKLFDLCRNRTWPNPECLLVNEDGEAHQKMFWMQYKVGETKFPLGAGRSKDLAKRRAAARAYAQIEKAPLRGMTAIDFSIF